jgi:predicted aspartyl protease
MAKGTVDKVAEIEVVVNGTTVQRALIDTGAAVTVVNKSLVDSLRLMVDPNNEGRTIIAANNEEMYVRGHVEMTLKLAETPIRLHALYVPEI